MNKYHEFRFFLFYVCVLFIILFVTKHLFVIYDLGTEYLILALMPYIFFMIGAYFTSISLQKRKIFLPETPKSYVSLLIGLVVLIVNWRVVISEYGNLDAVLANAFVLRQDLIGQNNNYFPLWTGYFFPIVFVSLTLHLAKHLDNGSVGKFYIVLHIIEIFLFDLLTFGRVGTSFAILLLVAYLGIRYGYRVFFKIRFVVGGFLLFLLTTLPRMIRGNYDNFENSLEAQFNNGISPPDIFNGIYAFFLYITQSFFTFGYAYETSSEPPLLGKRNLLPIFNIVSRLTGGQYESRIDPVVTIPFSANLYGAGWDFYIDFSYLGLLLVPLLYGLLTIFMLRSGSYPCRALGLYFAAAFLFWPFYNIFTFGTHFIAIFLLVFLSLLPKTQMGKSKWRLFGEKKTKTFIRM